MTNPITLDEIGQAVLAMNTAIQRIAAIAETLAAGASLPPETGASTRPEAAPTAASKPTTKPGSKSAEPETAPSTEPGGTSATEAPAPASEAPAETAAPLTYDEAVKLPTFNVSTKLGRPKAVALLAEFGASNGSDIKPEQYAAFKARAEALLAEAGQA